MEKTLNNKPKLRECSLRILTRREHSVKELRDKLISKGFEALDVARELETLARLNLQSDERFAQNFVTTKLHAGWGPKRIEQELSAKGVDAGVIASIVYSGEIDWYRQAQLVLAQKLKGHQLDIVRQQRFLYMRGFSFDMIKAATKAAFED